MADCQAIDKPGLFALPLPALQFQNIIRKENEALESLLPELLPSGLYRVVYLQSGLVSFLSHSLAVNWQFASVLVFVIS